MVPRPNEDTELHVQLLFVGPHRETGAGAARPCWRGALCYKGNKLLIDCRDSDDEDNKK